MSKARDLANAGTALTTVSATELGYVDGVTSAIQTQIDSKIGSASAINPTIVDAKGDIIAATAADTVARLAVGSANQVLTVDSSTATGLKWATPAAGGGMTLIETITLSGASVTSSTIPGTYKDLRLISKNYKPASNGAALNIRINGNTNSDYSSTQVGAQIYGTDPITETAWNWNLQQNNSATSTALGDMLIPDYANTTTRKTAIGNAFGEFETSPSTTVYFSTYRYIFDSTSAITSLTFLASTGNLTSGTVLIYGVN